MTKRTIMLWMLLLFAVSGCSGALGKSQTKTHTFMEHAGVDWFNF